MLYELYASHVDAHTIILFHSLGNVLSYKFKIFRISIVIRCRKIVFANIPIFFTNNFVGKSVIANDNKKLRSEIIFLM